MKGLRKITPYIPGEQPNYSDMIKLNTNENPYPPSPKVTEALTNFNPESLKRYSSVDNSELKKALSNKFGLSPEYFLIGNGSDEVLAFCFLAFFNSSDPLLFPEITYGFYKVWADLFHIPFKEIPLKKDFSIDLNDYRQNNGGIILANPNAPTGLFQPLEAIEKLLLENPDVIVIVDEAYIDFAGVSAITLLENYPNLIIIRTLSKANSLAGLRVGYAIGNPQYIRIAESIKSSFNHYSVDLLAETLATAAIEDKAYYDMTTEKICQTREWFIEELHSLGFDSLPSKTNFVLTTHPECKISDLYRYLEEQDIFVRYFPTVERLQTYLRISIGTQKEMASVLTVVKAYFSQLG
ncbi:histidinol-phosphate transaminase [Enterococcus wangshanyuanii]|uniref:Histidinol-phosphate aminotransferase n=1 Tax=Enterococcus wangshanyuanii TaxID=2005703 RepID=A0ABQ1NMM5_9ENTE|nr:histidinol-phosphate transaminase [Enterococcus wangshanyuanii]GGC80717.1 histidinol-phosphate aminotransferase [Enterococcus wangshanyuanii]